VVINQKISSTTTVMRSGVLFGYEEITQVALDAVAPFSQFFWEVLLSFAEAFIPVAIVVWDHQAATKAELETQAPRQPGT